jgi:hypothetical protein
MDNRNPSVAPYIVTAIAIAATIWTTIGTPHGGMKTVKQQYAGRTAAPWSASHIFVLSSADGIVLSSADGIALDLVGSGGPTSPNGRGEFDTWIKPIQPPRYGAR